MENYLMFDKMKGICLPLETQPCTYSRRNEQMQTCCQAPVLGVYKEATPYWRLRNWLL
jgi:hypothetical protein